MANNKPKYIDLEDWTNQFLNSKTTEERIAHINSLASHHFVCSFDFKDKDFVSLLIETLYSTAMNLNFGKEVTNRCQSKAVRLLESLEAEWNNMRPTLRLIMATSGDEIHRFNQKFIQTFIKQVDPSDSPIAVGAFVNHLCGYDQLHLLETDSKWIGHPLVIDWIMRSLAMQFSPPLLSDLTEFCEYPERSVVLPDLAIMVQLQPASDSKGTQEAVKSLLFHLAAAGELDYIVMDLIPKYIKAN